MTRRILYGHIKTCYECEGDKEVVENCINGAYVEKFKHCLWNYSLKKKINKAEREEKESKLKEIVVL